jgi:hypothetical protein
MRFLPLLWGRTKEGGRTGLSSDRATPHPSRPHKGGGCANAADSAEIQ